MYPTLRFQKYLRISLMVLLIVIVSTRQVLHVSAGTNIWTSNGPNGNSITAIVIDPVTPSTLYVGTDRSGVFRSTNSGESWEAVNSGRAGRQLTAAWAAYIFEPWQLIRSRQPPCMLGQAGMVSSEA